MKNAVNGYDTSGLRTATGGGTAANPVLKPTLVRSLAYALTGTQYRLQKAAPPVVLDSGAVISVSPDCDMIGLPNPDSATSWGTPTFLTQGEDDVGVGATCYELLLDEADNVLHTRHQQANIDNDTFIGYSSLGGAGLVPIARLGTGGTGGIDTGTSLPLVDVYNIGSTYVPGRTAATAGNPAGVYYMPSAPLLSSVGLWALDTSSGNPSTYSFGTSKQAAAAGSVGYPSPTTPGQYQVALILSKLLPTDNTPVLSAYESSPTPTLAWSSMEQPTGGSALGGPSGINPHPLFVPDASAPGGGRIYTVTNPGDPTGKQAYIYCFFIGGAVCPGFPDDLPLALDGVPTAWWYGGAVVPSTSDSSKVARLLYTVDVATESSPEHIGCLVAISPLNGGILEYYCVARDTNGRSQATNFLATAPVVAIDSRGSGYHTAFVAQYDSIVLAFDPMNLAAGPLATLDPIPAGGVGITITADYLTITNAGSIITVGWRVGTSDSEFMVQAIPLALSYVPKVPTPAAPGLSPGAAAGVAITVLAVLGALVLVPMYRSGALARYMPDGKWASYSSVPSQGGMGAKAFVGGSSGGYGSVSSASLSASSL